MTEPSEKFVLIENGEVWERGTLPESFAGIIQPVRLVARLTWGEWTASDMGLADLLDSRFHATNTEGFACRTPEDGEVVEIWEQVDEPEDLFFLFY